VVKEIITEILKKVIQDGKGIEVNTSSHRYGLKDLTPSRAVLRLYKDLGGKVITKSAATAMKSITWGHILKIQSWN